MEPAATIIKSLGGPTAVALHLGLHRTRVSNWARSKAAGGTGGSIPQKHIQLLMVWAREKGVELSHSDFFAPSTEAA